MAKVKDGDTVEILGSVVLTGDVEVTPEVTPDPAANGEAKKTRKKKASIDDVRLMSRHLHNVHGVNSGELFAQPFSKLSEIHASFHGQDDHWKAL